MKSTYHELIAVLSLKGERKRNTSLFRRFFSLVKKEAWRTGRFVIPGFVSFNARVYKQRTVRNPQTGVPMMLPKVRVMSARASKTWRVKR